MEKLEAVQKVLRFSTAIREWCVMEADEILERGLDEQIIEEDDLH